METEEDIGNLQAIMVKRRDKLSSLINSTDYMLRIARLRASTAKHLPLHISVDNESWSFGGGLPEDEKLRSLRLRINEALFDYFTEALAIQNRQFDINLDQIA